MSNIFIRNLQPSEMHYPIQLASRANLNLGFYDHEILFRAEPSEFFVAFFDEQAAGCISAINYTNEYGFIGLHLSEPVFIDTPSKDELLKVALNRLSGKNVGINCPIDQQAYYESFGFKAAHKIFTYEGISSRDIPMSESLCSPFMYPFEDLAAFDTKVSPCQRKTLLQLWLNQPQSLLMGKVVDKTYLGYGLFRPCEVGYGISPLFAEDYRVAEELLTALVYNMEIDQPYYMNVPETNSDAIQLIQEMKMKKVGEYLRMYTKPPPEMDLKKIYSFISSVLS